MTVWQRLILDNSGWSRNPFHKLRRNKLIHRHVLLFRIIPALLLIGAASSRAQNTVFTYQGRLNLNGTPANGLYDLSFGLYATNSGGSPIGSVLTNVAVPVANGLFTTALQFDTSFSGASYWLDISVRPNGGGTFSELSPRQWVTPTPQAIFANSANNLLGQVSADQINGTPIAAVNFTGSLSGDVTGPQGATVLSSAGTAGTYARVTTDAKGRVTSGATILPVTAGGSGQTNAAAALAAFGGASLNGNNIFSGLNTFNGTATFASPVAFPAGVSQNGVQSFPPYFTKNNLPDPCPFLDYSTYFSYGCNPTAAGMSNDIAALAATGMPRGFIIELDDGWENTSARVPGQALLWNTNTFPNGIASVINYAHSFGFKFMLYTSAGATTCCGNPASGGYEFLDAQEFASWGVDWIKVDTCGAGGDTSSYVLWGSVMQQVGKPIGLMMSTLGYPNNPPNLTLGALINDAEWGGVYMVYGTYSAPFQAMLTNSLDNAMLPHGELGYPWQIGPGFFNDCMNVGVATNSSPCPTNVTRQAMSLAALLASPIQFDGAASPANMSYITNSEIFNGILRDPLVRRCSVVSSNAGLEVLAKPLQNGSVAVGFVNRIGTANSPISVNWPAIGLASDTVCAVHDPWQEADIAFATNNYTASVPANDISVLIFRPQSSTLSTQGLTLYGTTNQITFGATSAPPASTNPVAWISVKVSGDTNQYRLPLMK